jgi:RNA polymerase sigma factor (sigma-70 family)
VSQPSSPVTDSPSGLRDAERLFTATLCAGVELIAMRRLGNADDARDAAQETMARALAAIHAGRAPADGEFPAYVHGILRHVIADRCRRAPPDAPLGDPPDRRASALDELISAERRSAVARELNRLGRADRQLLLRCFVAGERIADIAAGTGEPAERLRQRKSRALERLRRALGCHETAPAAIEEA